MGKEGQPGLCAETPLKGDTHTKPQTPPHTDTHYCFGKRQGAVICWNILAHIFPASNSLLHPNSTAYELQQHETHLLSCGPPMVYKGDNQLRSYFPSPLHT